MNSFWLSSVGGAFSKRRHAAVLRRQRRSRDLQRGEQLEERRVMAFDFVSAFPNAGQFITPNSTLQEAPQQITLRFSPGAKIDANTLGAISIVRSGSGSDPVFGNGNDVAMTPTGGVGIVAVDDFPNQNQVVLRFAETLPDDVYRITIGGGLKTEAVGKTVPSESFRNGASHTLDFRLDLGAQVVSVVPQPISRVSGAVQQARNVVEVFFNANDRLLAASAQNPRNYRLVETDPATGADVAVRIPAAVAYDAVAGKATLTFAADLGDKLYRLQIGGTDDVNNTTATAVGVGSVFRQTDGVSPAFVTNSFLGDGAAGVNDVDLYKLSLTGNAQLRVRVAPVAGSGFTPALRLFNALGAAVTAGVSVAGNELTYTAPAEGTFFFGLSSAGNIAYSAVNGSGATGGGSSGGYRLEIFSDRSVSAGDENSSFGKATGLGTLGLAGQAFNAAIDVRPMVPTPAGNLLFPSPPGTVDEPGHREIPLPVETHEMPASSLSPAEAAAVSYYSFPRIYGTDAQGNPLINAITENQKQRAREIFELYSRATGIRFVETLGSGLAVVTGDLRALDPSIPVPNGPAGLGGPTMSIMNGSLDWGQSEYGGLWQGVAMHEIGHSLGLGHSYDIPSIMGAQGSTVQPGDHDLVHFSVLYPADGTDIDVYSFQLDNRGTLAAETVAARPGQIATSRLDSVLTLYRQDPASGRRELVVRNDDYYGRDSFLGLELEATNGSGDRYTYFLTVTSTGNTAFNPEVENSGANGRSDGPYRLRMAFTPVGEDSNTIVDETGTPLDGDRDGLAGGAFNFWFRGSTDGNTVYVDKLAATAGADGSLAKPFNRISAALAAAAAPGSGKSIVRIVGNAAGAAATPYLVGTNLINQPLADGTSFIVPAGVTVMIDAGAVFKFRNQVIDVGSSSPIVPRAGAAVQVLGTPGSGVQFTSYHDDSLGGNSDGVGPAVGGGQWGGIIFRRDSDSATRRVFLNSVSNANFRYGGGQVLIDGSLQSIAPLHLESSRPSIAFNTVSDSAGAAISADPNSFEETAGRAGPAIRGNVVRGNSVNGLLVRIRTAFGQPLDRLSVAARFASPDITYVIPENLHIAGGAGGYETVLQRNGRLVAGSPTVTGLTDLAELAVGMRVAGAGLPSAFVQRTGSLTAGSAVVSGLANVISLEQGALVSGDGIPAGTRILSINAAAGTVTLSNNATVSEVDVDLVFDIGRWISSIDAATNSIELSGPATASGSPVALTFETLIERARASGRLTIDPGVVVKLQGSRIDLERGASQLYAEGTPQKRVIFTSTKDNRFGAGGTFVVSGDTKNAPLAGDWGGIIVNDAATASIDNALVSHGGGQTPVAGGFAVANVLSVDQGTLRLANSRVEKNANGIFVIGAQPVIVGNDFRGNGGDLISVDANSLNSREVSDPGRMTGGSGRFAAYDGNRGPLVRGNTVTAGGVTGMVVRGDQITVESVWDDTDIVHVLRDEIVVSNFHTATGLRLMSSPTASLVVKLRGTAAGLTATGYGLDIDDRIGGTVQVLGQPGYPVIMTSLTDDSVGASVDPIGVTVTDTNGDGSASRPTAGEWRGLRFLPYSNDRNVAVFREAEPALTGGVDVNLNTDVAQFLGVLAPNELGGDDNRRLGFEVHGAIAVDDPTDVDVYSFKGYAGSEVWIDIDNTSPALDAMVELLDASGTVLARSADWQQDGSLSAATRGLGAALIKNPALGLDFYSRNPRDPGMRVVLPGVTSDEPVQFSIRVRSQPKVAPDAALADYQSLLRQDPAVADTGATSGSYELRIRLQQRDEKPGSTVRYADLRYPVVGVDVQGLPQRSPLAGQTGETAAANNTLAGAQYVGNLLASDLNTISIAGALSSTTDIDWYVLDLNYEQIQAIGGVNDGGKTWSTVFDIDYADGFRGDLTLSVFDSAGRLIYVGRDSSIADDQPGAGQTNFEDVSRGSAGKLDPFIGPVHLPAGLPGSSVGEGGVTPPADPNAVPAATTRYYVAVSSNEQLPSVLDMTFRATATNSAIRLEPVNSIARVIEDRIGLQGYHSGEVVSGKDNGATFEERDYTYVPPTGGPLFGLPTLASQVAPFSLTEVAYYLSVSPTAPVPVLGAIVADDLAMRTDGRLYTYTGLANAANTAGTLAWINIRTNASTTVGNDSIPDFPAVVDPTPVTGQDAKLTTKAATTTVTTFQLANPANTTVDVATLSGTLQYTVTVPGLPPDTGTWTFTSGPTGQLSFSQVAGSLTLPQPLVGPTNSLVADNGVVTVTWSTTVVTNTPPGVTMTQVAYTYIPPPAPNNSLTTDRVDAATWHRKAGAGPVYDQLFYSVRDVDIKTTKQTGVSRLYSADPATVSANQKAPLGRIGTVIQTPGNDLGLTTGMTFIGDTLYGVDNLGHLFTINRLTGVAALVGTVAGAPNLQGLANGPQNAVGGPLGVAGYYADKLFAISATGDLYCIDPTTAARLPVFPGNADSLYVGPLDGGSSSYTGFAFSPLDIPLWRATNNRGLEPGHGVTAALDHTRDALYDNEATQEPESKGLTSIYYGLDSSKGTALDSSKLSHLHMKSTTWLTDLLSGVGNQVADLPYKGSTAVKLDLSVISAGSPIVSVAGTRDLAVGMFVTGPGIPLDTTILEIQSFSTLRLSNNATQSGSVSLEFVRRITIDTLPFSLENRTYTDKPTLYFNYRIEAGVGSAGVQISADGVRDGKWITIAAAQRGRSKLDEANAVLPNFPSVSSRIGQQPNQFTQELFEGTGWRQARIDLGEFAGTKNIRLRFGFVPTPVAAGVVEGVYIDDLIVGFAERGEMVTGWGAKDKGDTSFFTIGTPVSLTTPQQNLQGPYQLEIRRGMEYGELTSTRFGAVQIMGDRTQFLEPVYVVDSDASLVRSTRHAAATSPFNGYGSVTPGQNLRGDENTARGQGQFIIEGNVITHADQFGIRIDAAARDAATGAGTNGAVKNSPVLNTNRLVPGVVVTNNVIASTHREAAILFSGDPNTGAGPLAPVPYGRIVNNTIHGGVTVTASATTVLNSPVVTMTATDRLWAGMVVTGAGIPAGTRIQSVDSATQVTLTQAATAAGASVSLTFAFSTVGVRVTDNAAPTLLNNVFASLATAIQIDGSSASTVVGFSAFHNNTATGVAGDNALTLATDPFVNAAKGNFYPVAKSAIIDSALDVLQDRLEYVAVTQPLGLPQSPIIVPSRDLYGQLRSDDPGQASPPGLGSNVFKDLGAIDRVDVTQPWLTLAEPLDQGSEDVDQATLNSVIISGSAASGLTRLVLQLNDIGVGIDKTTVVKQAFTIVRNGTTLLEGTDYVFRYLESTNQVVFESPSAFALGDYEIRVTTRPATTGQDGYLTDLANNVLLNNNSDGTTSFRVLLIDLPQAPTGVAGTAGNGQVSLAWTAPANAFGITDYVVQYRTNVPGSPWQTFADGTSATLAATVTGLTNGTAYVFRVAALNAAGTGDFSAESAPVTPSAPASAPGSLTPTFGNGSVGLAWTVPTSNGGTSISDYVVQYRTDVVGSIWTTFNDGVGVGTTATVTGLTNGTAYRFRVAAFTGVGTGTYSSEVTETPRAVPSAPTGLSGVPGNARVVLTWTAAVANGAAVTDYIVEFKTVAAATWSTFSDGTSTATTATVTNLQNGTEYLFRVSAVNSVGSGSASSQVGPYTPAMPASAPTGLTPTFGNGAVSLSWTAPGSNGGSAITDYAVEYKTPAAATWSTFADGTSTTTSATVTGLTNGTAYMFRVAAINSVGIGTYSNEVTETPRAVPSAPTGVAGVPGNVQVALTWTAPAANGSAITDYMVEFKTVAAATWSTFADGTSTATSATVTGLTNGTAYLFRVKAVNAVGASVESAEAGPITPRTVPGIPTGFVVTPQNSQVALSWAAPTSDGGAPITDYVVQFKTPAAPTWSTFDDGMSAGTSATVTGLTNGTAYLFRVAAVNVAGTGIAVESAAVTPRTTPGSVTNLQATGASGRIDVNWTAPTSNGGAPITDYVISVSTSPTSGFAIFNDGVSTATSATITGLTNGTTYYVRVRARNAAGNSAIVQAGPVVPFIQAAAPTGLTGTVGSGRVNLAWAAAASSKPITDYVIQYRTDSVGSAWTTFADGVTAVRTATVTGLVNGTRYLFRVAGVNADGIGVFTDGTFGLTPMALPAAAPAAVTGRGAAGVITLNWSAVSSSLGAPVTGYVIQYRANTSTAKWVTLPLAVGNATTARITTLTSRLGYRFRVAAQNAAGTGPWSAASALIRPS